MNALPLKGIVVADFTKFMAGPTCTQYLSDLGAEVIKMEDREGGDDQRGMPPFVGTDGGMFLSLNRNKQSVALDMKTPEGRAVAHKLIGRADVLVESFATGVAGRLGLGYDALQKLNPRLVYCSISGFGRDGPLGPLPGFELMMQAFTGMMTTTGEPGGGPLRIGFSPLDQTTGIHAANGILAALLLRGQTGQGSYLEVSLYETALAFMGWHAQNHWITGELPQGSGSGHASLCPYQAFHASDGPLVLAVGSDNLWRKFCDAAGLDDYKDDPRYRANSERVKRYAETVALVQRAVGQRKVDEWMTILEAAGIPCSPVNTLDAVLNNEHTRARGMVMDYTHPIGGAMKTVALPVKLGNMPREVRSAPPLHGEHTESVLENLGYAPDEIEALKAKGIVGRKPR
jgi:crotonobetainyl-CoA:carnitine CoA-transferase CaiB-like acyl-CoA transferase